jgi:NAD(P) transhydrogenase subunit alpha
MSAEYQAKQAALVASHIAKQDIVITTALIPGRPAPVLVTEEMVKSMKPGSVVVDLAVEQGGNCPLSKPDEVVDVNGVKVVGFTNLPGRIAGDSPQRSTPATSRLPDAAHRRGRKRLKIEVG